MRKYARELEIKLSEINGTGRNGKITKEDLNGLFTLPAEEVRTILNLLKKILATSKITLLKIKLKLKKFQQQPP